MNNSTAAIDQPMNKPNPHLMALFTYLALVPLVYFIPGWISPYLPDNKLINVLVIVGIIVPIISYIVMPRVARWISR